jgi:hypothetical protein
MRYSDLRIIGDELLCNGELVAILTTNLSFTERGRFEDLIEFGEEDNSEKKPEETKPEGGPGSETMLLRTLRQKARGGLLRLADVEKWLMEYNS